MGRDALALSEPLACLSFLAGVGGAVARSDAPYPRPGSTPEEIRRFFRQPSRAPWFSVAGQSVSAGALAAFTVPVARLAGRAGPGSGALRAAALAGGGLAAASLATSARCAAALTGARSDADADAVALHRRAFVAGGPAHGAGFGLLVGALGLAGLRTGALPPPLARAGVVAAVPNLLSSVALLAEPAAWLIPAGRFPGLVVSAIAGVRLAAPVRPARRRRPFRSTP
jgi:hypothetical protein